MKLTLIGCTLLLASSLLYGCRLLAAAILNVGDALSGPGMQGIAAAAGRLGTGSLLIPLLLALVGLACLALSGWQSVARADAGDR